MVKINILIHIKTMLKPGEQLSQPYMKTRLKKLPIKDRLTIKEKKAADHYIDNGNKIKAIDYAYTMGTKGGSKTNKQKQYNLNSMSTQVFNRKRVQDYLQEQSSSAASRVVDLSITADSDAVRLNANKDILDRAGFKPKEVSEVEVIKTYDEEQIQRAIREIAEDDSARDSREESPDKSGAFRDDGAEGKE